MSEADYSATVVSQVDVLSQQACSQQAFSQPSFLSQPAHFSASQHSVFSQQAASLSLLLQQEQDANATIAATIETVMITFFIILKFKGLNKKRIWYEIKIFSGKFQKYQHHRSSSYTSISVILPASIRKRRAVLTRWNPCIPAAPGLMTSILRLGSRTTFRIWE